MEKMMKLAMVALVSGAMLGVAGCGGPESEYQDMLDKAVKLELMDKSEAKKDMDEFKAMTPEQQEKELKKAKAGIAAAEAMKKAME